MIAWKLVRKLGDHYAPAQTPVNLRFRTLGEPCGWGSCEEIIHAITNEKYEAGVHAWGSQGAADRTYRRWEEYYKEAIVGGEPFGMVKVKVLLRGPICEGEQDGEHVVVYKEMSILEEVPVR